MAVHGWRLALVVFSLGGVPGVGRREEKSGTGSGSRLFNLILYPHLDNFGEYTLRNEAALITSFNADWALRLASIWERDSDPAEDVGKNDLRTSVNLQYTF